MKTQKPLLKKGTKLVLFYLWNDVLIVLGSLTALVGASVAGIL